MLLELECRKFHVDFKGFLQTEAGVIKAVERDTCAQYTLQLSRTHTVAVLPCIMERLAPAAAAETG